MVQIYKKGSNERSNGFKIFGCRPKSEIYVLQSNKVHLVCEPLRGHIHLHVSTSDICLTRMFENKTSSIKPPRGLLIFFQS